jgi:ATP-dependent Clp protease adapter protein ClpS
MSEHDIPFGFEDVAHEVGRAVKVRAAVEPKPLRQYAVILHDSPIHTDVYVIEMVTKLCGMTVDQAKDVVQKLNGGDKRAVVFVAHFEVAELKASEIEAYGADPYSPLLGVKCDQAMSTTVEPV